MEPMTAASRPHGLMAANRPRSVDTLSAKPCMVTQRFTAIPIDASFRAPPRRPDAGPVLLSLTDDLPPRQRPDERLFQIAQIEVQIPLAVSEQEDRVADQLSRPVVGDVAPALDLEHRRLRHRQQVLDVGAAALRDHVRMLDEHQRIGDLVTLPRADQLQLPRPDLAVFACAEIEDLSGYSCCHCYRF